VNTERFRTRVFIGVLLLALTLCLALVLPFWRAIAWAVVLAILIYPTHRRIARVVRNSYVSAGLSTLLTVAVIVVPLGVLGVAAAAEGRAMIVQATELIQGGAWDRAVANLERGPLGDAFRWVGRYVDTSPDNLREMASQGLSRVSGAVTEAAGGLVKNVALTFIQTGLALGTLFFLLKDGTRALPAIKAFIPLNMDQTDAVLAKAEGTLYATFYGVVLVAIIQGTIGGLVFWALGIPAPLLWGLVMTALCIVPLAGAPIVWIPAAALLALQGEIVKALILVALGVGVIGTADNITRPFIIGGRTSLHPMAVFFAILGGLFMLGGVGIFLGPVLLSVTLALLDILRLKLGSPPQGPNDEDGRGDGAEEAGLTPLSGSAAATTDARPIPAAVPTPAAHPATP